MPGRFDARQNGVHATDREWINGRVQAIDILSKPVSCDQVEDSLENYTGPEIDELDFVAVNQVYLDIAIDSATQFPHNAIKDGALSGFTDPVSIAYKLQHLVDIADASSTYTKGYPRIFFSNVKTLLLQVHIESPFGLVIRV